MRRERLMALAGIVSLACGLRPYKQYTLGEPRPTCGGEQTELRAKVVDKEGRPLAGVPVIAATADSEAGEVFYGAEAGTDGWAVIELPGNHHYTVAAGYVGFVPKSGIVFLAAGCRVEVLIELEVAEPREIISGSAEVQEAA
jgi:hypothetical protein